MMIAMFVLAVSLVSPQMAEYKAKLIVDHPGAAWNRCTDEMIRRDLKKVLARPPVAVTDKKRTPDSGDKHDFMSFGDYWWPNDYTTNGLPFVCRDGFPNPEAYNDSDRRRIMRFCDDVATLASARVRLGDAAAGREGARRVRIFLLDPATAMNPNMEYAQAIPGVCKGRGTGVIDTIYLAYRLVDCILLLQAAGDLSDGEVAALRTWFSRYVDWLLTSDNGRTESRALNNHGSAWSFQTIVFADFAGREVDVRRLLTEAREIRIARQVASNGILPHELARKTGFEYETLGLELLCQLARLGERHGVDLWNYESAFGGSIRKAMAWLMPYLQREKAWDFEQVTPYQLEQAVPLLALWDEYLRSPASRRPAIRPEPWSYARTMDEAWDNVFRCNYAGSTHLLHGIHPGSVPMPKEIERRAEAADAAEAGMGECVMNTATMLLAALARWDATHDAESERVAALTYDALRLCATVSGRPGEVVAGVCLQDRKSFYPLKDFRHYTPYVFALDRLAAHPLSEKNGWRKDVGTLLADAAAFAAGRGVDPMEAGTASDEETCNLSELVRRQMAQRYLYDLEKDAGRRSALRDDLARRASFVVDRACSAKRLDALLTDGKNFFYTPYDPERTAAWDYVKEIGQRMVAQMLCPGRAIAGRDDFERRLRAIDFSKPCWQPPAAALWFYWTVERSVSE